MERTSERPAKRVRQACEPCRRKKARCPGEQPVCSLCARLNQECAYDGERRRFLESHFASSGISSEDQASHGLDDRLGNIEIKMGEILTTLRMNNQRKLPPVTDVSSTTSMCAPVPPYMPALTPLPTWDKITPMSELYLLYCESQPLPLFCRSSFLDTLSRRDPEIIFAILALSTRFSEGSYGSESELINMVNSYTETARNLVAKRVWEGPVELSTLQSLCILSLVDFTNGNTHRSIIHSNLAMNLALCAKLGTEPSFAISPMAREERRRCFWSILLLNRFYGGDLFSIDFPDEIYPPFPESPHVPPLISSGENSVTENGRSTDVQDQGIIVYVIMLSEVFVKTSTYVRRHGKPSSMPPWSSQSEYSKILALQMEMETRVPYTHRFKLARLSERTSEDLHAHRDYWGPWFLIQFIYHTNLCLLNHPLLLSLSLRNFRSSIPEIFLQHTSDLISSHTTWIIYFIDYFEEKSFKVSDPLLGYGAAVVATIELQLSFTEKKAVRKEKEDRFFKCVRFVENIGQKWPHMALMAERLQVLQDAVSSSYHPNPNAQNKSLVIDLSRFWEILEYSSNSDTTSAKRMFGDSLYVGPPTLDQEVSRTSPLPEPTRLDLQREQTEYAQPDDSNQMRGLQSMDHVASEQQTSLLDDEFAILATNFFSQGQDFLRSSIGRDDFGDF